MAFELNDSHQPRKLAGMLPKFEYVMQTRVITGKGLVMGE